MEEAVYERSVTKQAIANRVVDEMQISRHYKSSDLQKMYRTNFRLEEERPILKLPSDEVLAATIQEITQVFKYHEQESLLENLPEEELNEEEMKLAWEEFNKEKDINPQFNKYAPTLNTQFSEVNSVNTVEGAKLLPLEPIDLNNQNSIKSLKGGNTLLKLKVLEFFKNKPLQTQKNVFHTSVNTNENIVRDFNLIVKTLKNSKITLKNSELESSLLMYINNHVTSIDVVEVKSPPIDLNDFKFKFWISHQNSEDLLWKDIFKGFNFDRKRFHKFVTDVGKTSQSKYNPKSYYNYIYVNACLNRNVEIIDLVTEPGSSQLVMSEEIHNENLNSDQRIISNGNVNSDNVPTIDLEQLELFDNLRKNSVTVTKTPYVIELE